MNIESVIKEHESEKIRISDLGGQESYSFLWPEFLKKAQTLVLVYEKGVESNLYDIKDLLYKTVKESNIGLNTVKYVIPVATKMDLVDDPYSVKITELQDILSEEEKEEMGLEQAVILPTVLSSVKREDMKYNFYYVLRQIILYDYVYFKVSNNMDIDDSAIIYYPVVLFGRGAVGKSSLRDTILGNEKEKYTKTKGVDNALAISVGKFSKLHNVLLVEERMKFDVDEYVNFSIPMFTMKQ